MSSSCPSSSHSGPPILTDLPPRSSLGPSTPGELQPLITRSSNGHECVQVPSQGRSVLDIQRQKIHLGQATLYNLARSVEAEARSCSPEESNKKDLLKAAANAYNRAFQALGETGDYADSHRFLSISDLYKKAGDWFHKSKDQAIDDQNAAANIHAAGVLIQKADAMAQKLQKASENQQRQKASSPPPAICPQETNESCLQS